MKSVIAIIATFMSFSAFAGVSSNECTAQYKGHQISVFEDLHFDGIGTIDDVRISVQIDGYEVLNYFQNQIFYGMRRVGGKNGLMNSTKSASNTDGSIFLTYPEQDPDASEIVATGTLKLKRAKGSGFYSIRNLQFTCTN